MFTCPYDESSCGRDKLIIVPLFDQNAPSTVLRYSNFKKFKSKSYCRHEIRFPIEATFEDTIQINFKNLNRTEVTIGIAKGWASELIG